MEIDGARKRVARERILSPLERLSEVLFGLIMALTIIGSLSIARATRDDIRTMLVAAIGCNAAWGIVDGIMYLMALLVERRRGLGLLLEVQKDRDAARARRAVAGQIPPLLARSIRETELEHLRLELVAMRHLPSAGLTRRDFLGALGVFLLVFLSTFPVAVPFLLPLQPVVALRLSNAVALALLFAVGLRMGNYVAYRPIQTGLAAVGIGVVLVALTLALGG